MSNDGTCPYLKHLMYMIANKTPSMPCLAIDMQVLQISFKLLAAGRDSFFEALVNLLTETSCLFSLRNRNKKYSKHVPEIHLPLEKKYNHNFHENIAHLCGSQRQVLLD